MKNGKTCPKCGGTEILRVEDRWDDRGINLKLSFYSEVRVARYVCCGCGYVESWVDKHDLHEVRARYEKEKAKQQGHTQA